MKEIDLKDICEFIVDCPHSTAKDEGEGYPLIRTPNVGRGRLVLNDVHRVCERIYNERNERAIPSEGDIILAREAPVGNAAIITYGQKVCLGQRVVLIRANQSLVNPMFLVYYLLTDEIQHRLKNNANGAVVAHLNMNEIRDLKVSIPEIETQNKIAAVLSSFDEKLEINRRINDNLPVSLLLLIYFVLWLLKLINDNLQQQANALFKSWFVDFESFKDGEFTETELGIIPKGWQIVSLISVAKYLNGLAMQNYRPEGDDKGFPVLKIKELGQGMSDSSSDRCSSDIDKQYVVNDGDVIFSWSGTLLVDLWCGGQCGLNQHLFKVTSSDYPKWFYYLWTKQHLNNFIQIAKDKAVTMGHIKRGHLEEAKVLVPSETVMNKMTATMQPIIEKIIEKRIENRHLALIRDTILPKLMSGELKMTELIV